MPNFETPPALRGEAQNQLAQLHSYLYRLSEMLNVSLQDGQQEEGSGTGAAAQTPKALFESIRSLISNSSDILNVYYAEIAKKLVDVFVELEDYQQDKAKTEADMASQAKDIASLKGTVSGLDAAQKKVKDFVSAAAESTSDGLSWTKRSWNGGGAEYWAEGTMEFTAETAVSLPLPEAVSGAAWVSLGTGYAKAVGIRDGVVQFTPSESGSTAVNIYIHA